MTEESKSETDQELLKRVSDAIYSALSPYQDCNDVVGAITEALIEGRIPHVTVNM